MKKQIWDLTAKHLLQCPLRDDIKNCASSWNSLAQARTLLMQWKQPPLFKWLFDLIYFITLIPEGMWDIVLIIVQSGVWMRVIRLVFSTVLLNHKGIPGIHLNEVKLWSLLRSCGGTAYCSFVADNKQYWNTCPCKVQYCSYLFYNRTNKNNDLLTLQLQTLGIIVVEEPFNTKLQTGIIIDHMRWETSREEVVWLRSMHICGLLYWAIKIKLTWPFIL